MNILGCVTQEGIVNNGNCYLVLKDWPPAMTSIFYIANMRDGGRRCGRLS